MLEQPCPTCGRELDINEDICPLCGMPRRVRRQQRRTNPRTYLPIPVGVLLGGWLGWAAISEALSRNDTAQGMMGTFVLLGGILGGAVGWLIYRRIAGGQ